MRKSCSVFALLAVFVFCLSVQSVSAFKVSRTSSGAVIKWSNPYETYVVNRNGGPADALKAIKAAGATWTNVSTSSFSFQYGGKSSSTKHGNLDYINLVNFAKMGNTGVVAENMRWFNTNTGQLLDSDIQFNTSLKWSTNGAAGTYDVQNVMTHEMGHSLSLNDLYNYADRDKTMFGIVDVRETKKRTLHKDDIKGISYLYP